MISKTLLSVFLLFTVFLAPSQLSFDSVQVVKTLHELLSVCKNVDFSDPKATSVGAFYKAGPYIIYRGEDKTRAWKDFARYSNPNEKKEVDEVCFKINSTVNQDSSYKVIKYFTQKESEGTWLVVQVSYIKNGIEKKAVFAFLRIGDRYGLGDIDWN